LQTLGIICIYEQCFSLSACGARQITEEWGELNPNWHLEAFGAFYTPFWAAYGCTKNIIKIKFVVLP
jgi:hypothetical protein